MSMMICSKDSFEDVCFHLENADAYEVGEILFVTSCKDGIEAIVKYKDQLQSF